MTAFPRFAAQGDAALLAYLGDHIDPDLNARVRALAAALERDAMAGVREVLPAYCCLQVQFDPLAVGPEEVQDWVGRTLATLPAGRETDSRLVEVPTVYGGEHGPDLDFAAEAAGVAPAEFVRRHSEETYLCYLVGFTPGFPFLGGLAPELALPRLDSPRLDLPAGAVGIGASQTGLYPLGGPGGWRILGRTPLMVYDPRREEPCLIRAGDRVRFTPIDAAVFPDPPPAAWPDSGQGEPALEVLRPGAFTTVQDRGRWGFQALGVPLSGALDQSSLAAANRLVGNAPGGAALEMALLGPKLRVLRPLALAVVGADLGLKIDGKLAAMGRCHLLRPGQLVDFSGPKGGARAYLALGGGLSTPVMMGSRSAYPLGRLGGPLVKGQVLRAGSAPPAQEGRTLPLDLMPQPRRRITVRVIPGPNQDFFSPAGRETFFGSTYRVSQGADRRGMRLEGPAVALAPDKPTSIISEPNTPGVVQVPSGGQPIILLREQTVGGYAKIATVISADLDLLARALPEDEIRFAPVSPAEAASALAKVAAGLDRLA